MIIRLSHEHAGSGRRSGLALTHNLCGVSPGTGQAGLICDVPRRMAGKSMRPGARAGWPEVPARREQEAECSIRCPVW